MDRAEKTGRAPVDASKWSEKSKRSEEYHFPPAEYEDLEYKCWRCGAAAIFAAEQQREAFEVRQAYIWQRRILCPGCWKERCRIERAIRGYATRWKEDKRRLRSDAMFLQEWLALLGRAPEYALRKNVAIIAMLRRLLGAPRAA
jgi:hypothetical protein